MRWPSAQKNAHKTLLNSEHKPNIPLPTSDDRIRQLRRAALPRHRAVKHWLSVASVALIFGGRPLVFAAELDAAQYFEAGRLAFEAQNYAAALDAFEAALNAKLQGPAVHYNIGVAAYRLGRYARARSAFLEVARTPSMAALAHYNLGLIELRREDTRAATKWFERIASDTDDERLRALAATQLAALPPPPPRNWVGYAALSAGYDDNVALVSNPNVLGVSGTGDAFAESQLAVSAPLEKAWQFDAGAVFLKYQDLHNFDQMAVQSGGRYRLNVGRWANELGAQLAYSSLDGRGLENRQMLVLQTSTELYGDWRLRGRYRFSNINGLNDFTGIGGYRHEASTRLEWEHEPWNIGAAYQFDKSNLRDESLSATRHQLAISAARTIAQTWLLGCEITQRHSSYDISGKESRTEFNLTIEKALGTHWRLAVRYVYTDNEADLSDFNYRGNRISAGVQAFM